MNTVGCPNNPKIVRDQIKLMLHRNMLRLIHDNLYTKVRKRNRSESLKFHNHILKCQMIKVQKCPGLVAATLRKFILKLYLIKNKDKFLNMNTSYLIVKMNKLMIILKLTMNQCPTKSILISSSKETQWQLNK